MIRKVSGGWIIVSKKGKRLSGVYSDKRMAEKRLQQIEYFKHKK